MRYFGEDNDKHDFCLEVKSPRIHSLNWGSENNKKLAPPFPERFSRINPQAIKEKVQDCENFVSDAVLQMVCFCVLKNINKFKLLIRRKYLFSNYIFIF